MKTITFSVKTIWALSLIRDIKIDFPGVEISLLNSGGTNTIISIKFMDYPGNSYEIQFGSYIMGYTAAKAKFLEHKK